VKGWRRSTGAVLTIACAVAVTSCQGTSSGTGASSSPSSSKTSSQTPTSSTTAPKPKTVTHELLATDGRAGDNLGGAQAYDTFQTPIKPVYWATPGEAAMSSDGSIAVVGAPANAGSNRTGAGAVYVFGRSGGKWAQAAKLVATDGAQYDGLGWSVAVSGDGHTVVAGAPFADSGHDVDLGAAYVFSDSSGHWTQIARLHGGDSAAYDGFGWSVGISRNGALIAVGATGHDAAGVKDSGTAYVYKRGPGAFPWVQAAELQRQTPAERGEFGGAVALSADGSILAVTELSNLDGDKVVHSGSTTVFGSSDAWKTNRQRAFFADTNRNDTGDSDAYGVNATISDDGKVIAVAAPDVNVGKAGGAGATYVYRTTGDWRTPAQSSTLPLLPTDPRPFLYYGSSVALSADGSRLFIGIDGAGINDQGAAEVVELAAGRTPTAADRTAVDPPHPTKGRFGTAAAISADGTTALSTSPWLTVGGAALRGAAYALTLAPPLAPQP